MSNFKFSASSLKKLSEVDSDLRQVCYLALQCSSVDFGISEGLRTLEKQKQYVESGKSQTLDSKHLRGLAVDVYAYVEGDVSWDMRYYLKIADAFRQAAIDLGHTIRWGGSWSVLNSEKNATGAYSNYVDSKQNPFVDAPHFEILKG